MRLTVDWLSGDMQVYLVKNGDETVIIDAGNNNRAICRLKFDSIPEDYSDLVTLLSGKVEELLHRDPYARNKQFSASKECRMAKAEVRAAFDRYRANAKARIAELESQVARLKLKG